MKPTLKNSLGKFSFFIKWGWLLLFCLFFFLLSFQKRQALQKEKEWHNDKLKLVWSDEFDYEGLPDSTKWGYDYGTGCELACGCGWGNNELQFYTKNRPKNARVSNGHLIIEAHRENWENKQYTSTRLHSKNKGEWQYGRVEIKAKLPQGRGVWAALWMLPSTTKYGIWPASGEIDIMEYVGFEANSVYATVHTKAYNGMIGTQKGGTTFDTAYGEQFHIYAVDWQENEMTFSIDGKPYFHFSNDQNGFEAWPFDHPFYLIMNIAVGGNWGGAKGIDEGIWPQKMEIDYVRVYQ